MKKSMPFTGSIFLLLSFHFFSPEHAGCIKKHNTLEQDVLSVLTKRLESLYKIKSINNSEILDKEIETLKEKIEELRKNKMEYESKNFNSNLVVNVSKDKGGMGVNNSAHVTDDLVSHETDFIGQGKNKIRGDTEGGETVGDATDDVAVSGDASSPVLPTTNNLESEVGTATRSGEESPPKVPDLDKPVVEAGYLDTKSDTLLQNHRASHGNVSSPSVPAAGQSNISEGRQDELQRVEAGVSNGSEGGERQVPVSGLPPNPGTHEEVSESVATTVDVPTLDAREQSNDSVERGSNVKDVKVKYLDELYDEFLGESRKTGEIHVPTYHSKYNEFREKYEFTMNPVEYEIMKNLFNNTFKKEGHSDSISLVDSLKKALTEEKFQTEFDNFIHGLYGFVKRHNYLSDERMKNVESYKSFLKNALSLLNTVDVK
ncbi:merozoite surface protein 7 [Plasmodium gonderi]|uniref:Merozoite surface protein 7 n=1 Tax=Plasmodium gonderi TaxID=77519 RepID=A0A1Y1JI79_PLAGO|nr:merozoite surface protein 7 [Plasmodium gonderi]GAW82221.1 merozoite surface protein 7 [Plasmodium gonderi]